VPPTEASAVPGTSHGQETRTIATRRRWFIAATLALSFSLSAVSLGPVSAGATGSDPDGDGLTTAFETDWSHTDPDVADTDGDGTPDGEEDPDHDRLSNLTEQRLGLDPRSTDTDRDGIRDGAEDPDGDHLSNAGEQRYGTDPLDADTDGDGTTDWHEDSNGDGIWDGLTQDAAPVPPGVIPSVSHLRDRPESYRACHRVDGQSTPKVCVLGSHGPKVVLFGDSHALQWRAPLQHIAATRGWRLYLVTKSSCPVAQIPGLAPDCVRWRKLAFEMIAKIHPAMIIASNYDSYVSSSATNATDNAHRWRHGLTVGLHSLKRPGIKVVLLGDTSRWHRPQDCIRRHMADISKCSVRRSQAVSAARIANDRAAATAAGARYVKTVDMTCPYDPCPIVIDRMILAYDSGHLTNAFSRTLWRGLGDLLPRP